jgi:hypothetical protein
MALAQTVKRQMTKQSYICRRYRSVGPFEYTADFALASSPIYVRFNVEGFDGPDQGWQQAPFQVRDCRYSRKRCEHMIADYFRY